MLGNIMNRIAICTVLKDEHQYLKEWIEYHMSIGVNSFYLYEDGGKSHSDICSNYNNVFLFSVNDYLKTCKHIGPKQKTIYNQFIKDYKNEIDYVFFIDLDEFIMFGDGYSISDLVDICQLRNAILLPWKNYGCNGIIDNPHTPVITTYLNGVNSIGKWNDNYAYYCKSFVKLNINDENHYMITNHKHALSDTIVPYNSDDLYQICWINHYITKSWEEWCHRLFVRGQIFYNLRNINDFFVYNPDMLPLKQELYKKPYFLRFK